MKLLAGKWILLWVLLEFNAIALAQSSYEMKLLDLYFPQKNLVISASRYPKPVSKTAENVTIVTGDEIVKMNAHTVADVLDRVPGLFISSTRDFGATSFVAIQGSEDRHVRVMLDGIQWNFLSDAHAETNSIPVGIIDRIEIIKGPASSAWGSSLGGVINIITKQAGTQPVPAGSVSAAAGKNGTLDYNGQLAGRIGPAGYYLYGGRQESDGLWNKRGFDNASVFTKFHLPLMNRGAFQLSFGYSRPENDGGAIPYLDAHGFAEMETQHVLASFDMTLTNWLDLKLSTYHIARESIITLNGLGLGWLTTTEGEFFSGGSYDEKATGGSAKLVWKSGRHTGVLGFDADHGDLDQTILAGSTLQDYGAPGIDFSRSDMDRWAVFVNDTISIENWSITPGVRLDYNSVADSVFSPSLGIAYNLKDHTILRGTCARGFNYPPLSLLSGGGLFIDPNPNLAPEDVWSYQLGVETIKIPYLWLRISLFLHDQEKTMSGLAGGGGPPAYNDIFINVEGVDRQGIEAEIKTRRVYDLAFLGHWAYVDIDPAQESDGTQIQTVGLGLEYDNPRICYAQIFGRYVDWGDPKDGSLNYDDIIWDFNINKELLSYRKLKNHLFVTAHNIFNGSQYVRTGYNNPGRWVEAGIRCDF